MLRLPPTAFPGRPHHVVPRGHSHQDIFLNDADRLEFLDCVATASTAAGLEIWAYALMRNHVHMIAVPEDPDSISVAMEQSLAVYAQWFSERHRGGECGEELWHRRCHASVIQPRYLWDAVRYVERNPVRARIVSQAQDYPWSSASYHCGHLDRNPLVGPASPLKGALADWASWLSEPDRNPELVYLRRKHLRSTPHCHPEFIGLFERDLDRRISKFHGIRDRPMG